MNDERKEPSLFDGVAATWDDNPMVVKLTEAVAGKIIDAVPLADDMDAMEFGCGTGLVSMGLAPRLGSIVAVDSSEKMLEVLAWKIEAGGIGHVETFLSGEECGLPDGRFSLIFSNMAMHHIADVPALLAAFHASLSPGGYIAIADLDSEDGSFHGDMEGIHHHGFSREWFLEALSNVGFGGCETRTVLALEKEGEDGRSAEYSVFLATARKT